MFKYFPLNCFPVASVSDFLVLLGVLNGVELTTGVDSAVCIAAGCLISGVSGRGARLRIRQFMNGLLVFGVEIDVKQTLFVAGGPLSAVVTGVSPLNGGLAVFSLSSSSSYPSSSDDMSPKSSRIGRRSLVDVGLSSSRGLFSDVGKAM